MDCGCFEIDICYTLPPPGELICVQVGCIHAEPELFFFFDGMLTPNFGCLESQVAQVIISKDISTLNSAHTYCHSTANFASFETNRVI